MRLVTVVAGISALVATTFGVPATGDARLVPERLPCRTRRRRRGDAGGPTGATSFEVDY